MSMNEPMQQFYNQMIAQSGLGLQGMGGYPQPTTPIPTVASPAHPVPEPEFNLVLLLGDDDEA